nr:MAG TPA: hypothetical protein [Caudoviricetes sp.]
MHILAEPSERQRARQTSQVVTVQGANENRS